MFTIDLNDPKQFTKVNVARLIGSEDDDQHWQLRVRDSGVAYLSDVVGNNELEGLTFRIETWAAGNDYVGKAAASDEAWVDTVYKILKESWPNPTSTLIDW
ncbi:MAG: hypothetical protein DDT26_02388 [Dehalococcoidia bacterium]|nr:hypothetical protein [Chloroflexota bacterium]